MQALIEADIADIAVIADPVAEMRETAHALAPDAMLASDLDGVLAAGVDGVVIATPSALHAAQSIDALRRGVAVFCQKPLGRTGAEVQDVIDAAQAAGCLLGVDLSYRFTQAIAAIRPHIVTGALGRIYAVDLVFHNAYGPDKAWFHDRAQSGGGCVIDLGVHLVDLCLWTLGFPAVEAVRARLFAKGEPWSAGGQAVEDYATAQIDLAGGTAVQLACSWNLSLGRDAAISAAFHGTQGGALFSNVDGSFYNFTASLHYGTATTQLTAPPDAWGGRALVAWAAQLARSKSFDPACIHLRDTARVLDQIYAFKPAR